MNKKEVVKKGYTLVVTSWENDGDNYKTLSLTIEDKEQATKTAKLIRELFCSAQNGETGIGNLCEDELDIAEEIILDYLEENDVFEDQENMTDKQKIKAVMNINYSVLGGCEWYVSRVFESMEIYYSPDPIFVETVTL